MCLVCFFLSVYLLFQLPAEVRTDTKLFLLLTDGNYCSPIQKFYFIIRISSMDVISCRLEAKFWQKRCCKS